MSISRSVCRKFSRTLEDKLPLFLCVYLAAYSIFWADPPVCYVSRHKIRSVHFRQKSPVVFLYKDKERIRPSQRVWSSAKERSTDMQEEFNQLPQIDSRLRKNILRMPEPSFRQAALSLTAGASKASSLRPTLPSSETATPTRSLPSIPSRPSRQSATPSSKRPTFRSSAALAAARRRACARYLWQRT